MTEIKDTTTSALLGISSPRQQACLSFLAKLHKLPQEVFVASFSREQGRRSSRGSWNQPVMRCMDRRMHCITSARLWREERGVNMQATINHTVSRPPPPSLAVTSCTDYARRSPSLTVTQRLYSFHAYHPALPPLLNHCTPPFCSV